MLTFNFSDMIGSLWFYFKAEATNSNIDIASTDNFKSLSIALKSSKTQLLNLIQVKLIEL